jgi:hypothetical protein
LVNVYRASDEFLEKRTVGLSKEKNEKILRKWCKENFINSRSLRHARDIHRLAVYYPCQKCTKMVSPFRRSLISDPF